MNFTWTFRHIVYALTVTILSNYKSIGPYNIHTPYWRCLYHVFYTNDELYRVGQKKTDCFQT